MGTYAFPIGVRPDLLDGAEPFEVTFTSPAMLSNITAAFQATTTSVINETRLCDVGEAPNYDTPDGTLDNLAIECITGQWVTDANAANYNFDIELLPGDEFLGQCTDAVLFYVANDGVYDDCPDFSNSTGVLGMEQTTFGTFDIPTVAENSITTSLEVIRKDDNRIQIYPNPLAFQESLFINIQGDVFEGESVSLEIMDAIGRTVLRQENVSAEGQHEIQLADLSAGLFQIVLKNSRVIANRSIVLQR